MIWKHKDPIFFKMMGMLWVFPSIGALVILGISEGKSPAAVEKILAGATLMVHVYLVYRWMTAPKRR